MTHRLPVILATAAFALGGCVVAEAPSTSAPPSAAQAPSSMVVSNCLAAVANEVQNPGVSLIRTEVSEGDGLTNVYVNVPGAQAPWICRATAQGSVVQVMYSGSEGAL
jgi:hypothetical protein